LRESSIPIPVPAKAKVSRKPELVVNVDTVEKAKIALQNGADWIMFGGETFGHRSIAADDYREVAALAREWGKGLILATPRIVKECQMPALLKDLELFGELRPAAVSVGNFGTLYVVKQQLPDVPLHADYPLNIFNSLAINYWQEQGVKSVTLSPELNFGQIAAIAESTGITLECLVHGYITLMVSEFCALGSYLGNLHRGECNSVCLDQQYWLQDRKDEKFPVTTDQFCRMHILNAKELSMLPHVNRFARIGIDRLRIEAKFATAAEVAKITALYRELIDQGEDHPTLVQGNWEKIEHANITRGHYFRGVL